MIRDAVTLQILEITLPCLICKADRKFIRKGAYLVCECCGSILGSTL